MLKTFNSNTPKYFNMRTWLVLWFCLLGSMGQALAVPYTDNTVAGDYAVIDYGHQFADGAHPNGQDQAGVGTLTLNSNGTFTETFSYSNVDGVIQQNLPVLNGTYTVSADGAFTITWPQWPDDTFTGSIANGGKSIVAAQTSLPDGQGNNAPEFMVATKKGGTFSNASLSGNYAYVDYSASTNGNGASSAEGIISFDGDGHFTVTTGIQNYNGVISEDSGSGTYTVSSTGELLMTTSEGDQFKGGVTDGGNSAIGMEISSGWNPWIIVMNKIGGTYTNASTAGSYSYVQYRYCSDSVPQSQVGNITNNSDGTLTVVATLNNGGVIMPINVSQIGSYTLSADGTLTVSNPSGGTSIGRVTGGGSSITLSEMAAARCPEIFVAYKNTPIATADTTAPTVPTGLSATAASSSQINLSWTASTDAVGVTVYQVYRGGTLLATLGNVTSYSNTGLTASTTYSYTVAACDAASNCSTQSAAASATTAAATAPPTGATATAVEYYNSSLNHYFMTANPDEAAALDAKPIPQAWQRTGKTWSVWKSASAGLSPVCRFFGTDAYEPNGKRIGANSHFYTVDPAECDYVKTGYQKLANDGKMYPAWTFEENAYYAVASTGTCPSGSSPIYRLYNDGQGGEPNHRYYTDPAVKTQMLAQGWVAEPANGNPVMCGL